MNPESEDPNNHVPELSADDDWTDLEEFGSLRDAQLPPRRGQGGREGESPLVHILGSGEKKKKSGPKSADVLDDSLVVDGIGEAGVQDADAEHDPIRTLDFRTKHGHVGRRKIGVSEISGVKQPVESTGSRDSEVTGAVHFGQGRKAVGLRVSKIGAEGDAKPVETTFHAGKTVAEVSTGYDGQLKKKRKKRQVVGESDLWQGENENESRRGSWVLLTGIGIILLVVFAVYQGQRLREKQDDSSDSVFTKLEADVMEEDTHDETMVVMKEFNAGQGDARRIYGMYMTAKSPQDLREIIYNASENMPIVEEHWKPRTTRENWIPSEKSGWSLVERKGSYHAVLSGMGPDFEKFDAYFRMEGKSLKIDWKATTGYGSASFEELQKGEGDPSEIRAKVSLADFFTYTLPENRFRCYRMVSPDGERNIWGYARIGSPQDETLKRFFQPREITGEIQREVLLILVLSEGPEASMKNQWMIESIISDNWIEE